MRRLIINADDFGLTPGVNRAIVEAHANGIVSSATVMAGGAARAAAVALSSANPRLSVGCHLVLVDGKPVLDPAQVSTLLDSDTHGGIHFHSHLSRFATRALAGKFAPEQIEAEAIAQIRALQQSGITVSHFDTHKHTHIFPSVLRPLLQAAKACGISALRNPFGPRLPLSIRDIRQRPKLWKRLVEVRLLGLFASRFRQTVNQFGLRTPDGSFGVVSTGALDLDLFNVIINAIPEGTWEFVCHPGYNDSDLASVRTRLRQSREKELEILTSTVASEALDRRGIQLISYREL
ncbi:MAG TPA: ChbG/HpnK family deacetylase [Terriglobales bacterium]|nr:ChbG/HpnK family deacetylase [Terriglobales bacterium]